ncbi:hypothetical protein B0H16DRAFT_1824606, partial [Mycena metata]
RAAENNSILDEGVPDLEALQITSVYRAKRSQGYPRIDIVAAGQEFEEGSVAVQQELRPKWTWSQVCRRFCDVIVGTPGLWTIIDLDLHSNTLADITNLYFNRSQACILNITFRGWEDIENDSWAAEWLSVIVPHIHRIRQLRLFLSAHPQIVLAPLRHLNTSHLERLEIRNTVDEFDVNPVELFSAGEA